jgi:GTP-binding protein EngB required for normal cell division
MSQSTSQFNLTAKESIAKAAEIADRRGLASLAPLLRSCHEAGGCDELEVAVVGRFKAGKSSFLNNYLQRDLLPVGVVPVTTVVTEIRFGPRERAVVRFLDGRVEEIQIDRVHEFVSEAENPNNQKHVETLQVDLPSLESLHSLRFVDMPGLESALEHNTKTSLARLPRVGLSIVAISVDSPLAHHDLELLRTLRSHTPNVVVLLTKVDLLSESQVDEVVDFVRSKLSIAFDTAPPIFEYSVRSGYEPLREQLRRELIDPVAADFKRQHFQVLRHKIRNLLGELEGYLRVGLASAEIAASERHSLSRQVLGEVEQVSDLKTEIRLLVESASGSARRTVETRLGPHKLGLERTLSDGLRSEFPKWRQSLACVLSSFENWITSELLIELPRISECEGAGLATPLEESKRRVFRVLQGFRDQISDHCLNVFGVPLRTTEIEISIEDPRTPDIRVGRVFDRNWELLSAVVPMTLVKGIVFRHFQRKLSDIVEVNLSRLASQWEVSLKRALSDLNREAEHRIDQVVDSVSILLATQEDSAPGIRSDLQTVERMRGELTES